MATQSKKGLLILEPSSELHFPGPALRPARTILKLINESSNKVAFKIKTTAPSFYGVRPNAGFVPKLSAVEVEIGRQPISNEQSRRLKHKFMVQSMIVDDNADNVSQLWQNVDVSRLDIVKLRCVFEDEPRAYEISTLEPFGKELMSPDDIEKLSLAAEKAKPSESLESIRRLLEVNTNNKRSEEPVTMPASRLDAQRSTGKDFNNASFSPFKLLPSPQKSEILSVRKLESPERSYEIIAAELNPYTKSQMEQPLLQSEEILTSFQIATIKAEIEQLRLENKNLCKENEMLKEEIQQRYRTHSPVRGEYTIAHTELFHQQQQRQVPVYYVIASMSFALLCILIGKFML